MTIDYTKLINQLDPEPDGEDSLKPRTAIVDTVNVDGTLNIILSGVIVPNVPRLASVGAVVGDAVQVQVSLGGMLVVGTIASVSTPSVTSSNGINGPATTDDSLTSNTYVNMAGTGAITSFSFTKRYAASRIKVTVHASSFLQAGSNTNAMVGVLVNGTDYDVFNIVGVLNNRLFGSGVRYITGVPAGVYTVQVRWRRSTGTGTFRRDSVCWLSAHAEEASA